MSHSYYTSARQSRSNSPCFSEQDVVFGVTDTSSFIRVEQMIAKSPSGASDSLRISREEPPYNPTLSDRVKAYLPTTGKLNKPDIVPRVSYDDMPRRPDLPARSPSNRAEPIERSPVRSGVMKQQFESSSISETYLPKGFALYTEETTLLTGQVSELQRRVALLEQENRSLRQAKLAIYQHGRTAHRLEEETEHYPKTIERLREELASANSGLNRALQKQRDLMAYNQALEAQLARCKADHETSQAKMSKEYKELNERYNDLKSKGGTHDRHIQLIQQQGDDNTKPTNLRHHTGDGRRDASLMRKIEQLEVKLGKLEGKHSTQIYENHELKRRLIDLLDQLEESSRVTQASSNTRGAIRTSLSVYDSASSEERLPQRPLEGSSRTPKPHSKAQKVQKKTRDLSVSRRESCKFHCCRDHHAHS